jgi:tRNA (guanine37-N1)-methyltransferase
MSSERYYLSVSVRDGEKSRKVLSDLGLLDGEYKIIADDGMLFLPIMTEVSLDQIQQLIPDVSLKTGKRYFENIVTGPRTLAEALEGKLTASELALLPRAYDLIGDIAVLEIPDEIAQHSKLIGEVFHDLHRNFKTILAKRGAVSGTTRIREYDLLSGENRTKTIHTEYGCRLAVDIEKAYFSPRLLEEHNRIAQIVEVGETVVDMFCGVGPFAIHIARQKQAHVIAIDINPSAIELLRESLTLNKLIGSVHPVIADAHDYVKNNKQEVDRVIMNHPSGASEFVHDACSILKSGGTIHYYDFIGGDAPEGTLTEKISKLIKQTGRSIKQVSTIRRVRDSAPYEYQMVADIVIDQ